MLLDAISNGDGVNISDELLDKAGEEFKAALKKQLDPEERTFKLRASNIGRPLCQLQMEQRQAPKSRNDYNHVVRMLIGDCTETVVNLLVALTDINVTDAKRRVEQTIGETLVKGEDDIEIDNKVWDVKSASAWAFDHKWSDGWDGVWHGDTFGYVDQLYFYAEGKPERMGGWIVVNKSTGEIKVVEARPTAHQLEIIRDRIAATEHALRTNAPFRRCFEEEDETFYSKPTGNKVVPTVCTFCPFIKECWKEAKQLPKTSSKAQHPPLVWYTYVKEE